ncbi:hypothetical protein [Coleofasciculus sp. E1-EBD-02]
MQLTIDLPFVVGALAPPILPHHAEFGWLKIGIHPIVKNLIGN